METSVAWQNAIEHQDGPSCLLLSRQNLPALPHSEAAAKHKKGGYVISDCNGEPEAILLATDSEVQLALMAAIQLSLLGKRK